MKKDCTKKMLRVGFLFGLLALLPPNLIAQEESDEFVADAKAFIGGLEQYFADDYFRLLPLWASFGSLLPSAGDGLLKLSIRLPLGVVLPAGDGLDLGDYVKTAQEAELRSFFGSDFGDAPNNLGLGGGLEVNWQPFARIPGMGFLLKKIGLGLRGLYGAQFSFNSEATNGNLMSAQGLSWVVSPSLRLTETMPFVSVSVGSALHMNYGATRRQFKVSSFDLDDNETISFDMDYGYRVRYFLADFSTMLAVGVSKMKIFGGYAALVPMGYNADIERIDIDSNASNFEFRSQRTTSSSSGSTTLGSTQKFDLNQHNDDELMKFRNKFILGLHVFGFELHSEWTKDALGFGLFYNLVL